MPPEWLGNMELVPTSNTPHPQAQAQLTPGAANASASANHLLYVNIKLLSLAFNSQHSVRRADAANTLARQSTRHNSQLSLGEGWRAARGLGAENGRKNEYDGIATTEMHNIPCSDRERDDRRCWSWCGARGEQTGRVMGRVGRIFSAAVPMLVPAVLMLARHARNSAVLAAMHVGIDGSCYARR